MIDILDSSSAGFQLWYLINPASGSNTFNTNSSGARTYLASYNGVLQSGFPDSSATDNSTTNPKTLATTTVLDNCWIVAFAMDSQGSVSPTAPLTSRATTGGFSIWADSNAPKTPAGSYSSTITWTAGVGSNCAMVVVSFAPAPAVAAPSGSFNFL